MTAIGGNTNAAVSWTAPVFLNYGTLTGYTATTSPGAFTCTTTSATSCTITGLTSGATYAITVTTTATTGTSAPSTAANVTVLLDGRFSASTDAQGRFEFPLVASGPHEIRVVPDNLPLPWAIADDGVVKAVQHADRSTTGIMWHPERMDPFAPADIALFQRVFRVA